MAKVYSMISSWNTYQPTGSVRSCAISIPRIELIVQIRINICVLPKQCMLLWNILNAEK